MRHDPMFYPGPLLRLLCRRKDGKDFRFNLEELTRRFDSDLACSDEINCQRVVHGQKYDIRVVTDVDGNRRSNRQSALLLLTAHYWDENDKLVKISEAFDVSVNERQDGRRVISNGSTIMLRLPMAIPATIISRMIGARLRDYADTKGVLGLYADLIIKQVDTNHPDDAPFVEILLDGIAWDANIHLAWQRGLSKFGLDVL
jgi:hypothetical protein